MIPLRPSIETLCPPHQNPNAQRSTMNSGDVSALLSDAHNRSNVFGHIVIRKAVSAHSAEDMSFWLKIVF
jgi:hypothetical protein